jgi:hypothetical protein
MRIEKMTFFLVSTARKLKPYFQSHQIIMLMDQPLRQIIYKLDMSGYLVKWAIELGEYKL